MRVIHFSVAYKALDNYVNSFNAKADRSDQKLKTAVVAAAKEIIRIYGASLLKKNSEDVSNWKHLPALHTNNKQLATLIKCSPRSIQRYISKLRRANIVTGKLYHGPNANYELWINPEILLVNVDLPVKTPLPLLKQPELNKAVTQVKHSLFNSQQTDRLQSYSGNIINNILKEVNNDRSDKPDLTGNMTGNAGEIVKASDIAEDKNSAATFPAFQTEQTIEQLTRNEELLNMYVDLFWLTAKNLLYKYTSITKRQEQTARQLIRNLYPIKNDCNLQAVHNMYIQRIKLAAEYVQKDPVRRFIPLPYVYFNLNNAKGFQGTEEWYWQAKKYQVEVDRDLLLEKLIRRYKNNEHMLMSQRQPLLKLYKACEKRLAVYNDDGLMNRFYLAVLELHGVQI